MSPNSNSWGGARGTTCREGERKGFFLSFISTLILYCCYPTPTHFLIHEQESVESQGRPRQQTRPSKKRVAPVAQQRELTEPKPFGFSTEARSAMRNAMSRSENESNKKMTDGKGAKRKRGFGAEITNSPLSSGGKGNAAAAYII